jgi:hypothetical protein
VADIEWRGALNGFASDSKLYALQGLTVLVDVAIMLELLKKKLASI